jgi:hypothetical protein
METRFPKMPEDDMPPAFKWVLIVLYIIGVPALVVWALHLAGLL